MTNVIDFLERKLTDDARQRIERAGDKIAAEAARYRSLEQASFNDVRNSPPSKGRSA